MPDRKERWLDFVNPLVATGEQDDIQTQIQASLDTVDVTRLSQAGQRRQTIGLIQSSTGDFIIDPEQQLILMGEATAPLVGTGVYFGFDDPDHEFRVGDPSGAYMHWDGSNLTIVGAAMPPGPGTSPSTQGWTQDVAFSVTDFNTVAWGSGSLRLAGGTTYSIGAGTTGNMTLPTYIYLDTDVSTTAYQTSTSASDSVGANRVLVAVASPNADTAKDAEFQVFGGTPGPYSSTIVTADVIAADTITANELAANSVNTSELVAGAVTTAKIDAGAVTADKITTSSLSALSADMGTLTAGKILMGAATDPTTGIGIFIGEDEGAYELRAGDPSGAYMHWDGSTLNFTGGVITAPGAGSTISLLGWTHSMAFSATDHDTVAWGAGTITLSNGDTFSIVAGNTGNITSPTYIYLDTDDSSTVLQTSTLASDAVGQNKILIAVANDVVSGRDAQFQVFGGADSSKLSLITADVIAGDTITANELAANSVNTSELVSEAVTTDKLDAGAVTAVKIDSGAVTTDKLDALAVTAAKIASNTITANELAVQAVQAKNIYVGSNDNLSRNPGFEQSDSGALGIAEWREVNAFSGSWSVGTSTPKSGARYLQYDATSQTGGNARAQNSTTSAGSNTDGISVAEGDELYCEAYCRSATAGTWNQAKVRIVWRSESGVYVSASASSSLSPTTSYALMSASGTAPSGAAQAIIEILVEDDGNGGILLFDDVYARRMVTGSIVVDGSLTADKITASTLSAITADMGTLDAGKITAGSIEINADTERILMGAATGPTTGNPGIFIGKDGSDYELRIGDMSGEYMHWDGSDLFVKGTSIPALKNLTSVSHTGDTVETVLRTLAIAAGKLGTDGGLRYTVWGSKTGTAGNLTVRLKLGGTAIFSRTITNAQPGEFLLTGEMHNNGSASAQSSWLRIDWDDAIQQAIQFNDSSTVNTSVAINFEVSVQNANSGDTATIYGVVVEYIGAA